MPPASESSLSPPGLVDSFLRVADRLGIGIIVCANESASWSGTALYANVAACLLLGVSERQLLGQVVDSMRFGQTTFVSEVGAETQPLNTLRERRGHVVREDGQRIDLVWSIVDSVAAGTPLVVHFLAPGGDMASITRAERDSEQRFRRLMDIAPDGILVLAGRRIEYANQAITAMHGYSTPRQMSQLQLRHLFHADDCEVLERNFAAILDRTTDELAMQVRALHRDGRTIPVEIVLYPTDWDDTTAILATVRDLAGRRLVQSQIVHTDRLAAVGTLAAGVAHEINNPLAYVLLNLQYLIREVPKINATGDRIGHLVERLREARHGAERVVSIVRDLRTFSKVDEEQLGPVDLRRVLLSAIKVARTQLLNRGQIIEIFQETRAAYGHSARLEQVFLNLLINAIQALPNAPSESNRITIRLYEERRGAHDYVIVAVADNGAGIPPENLDRVFDPFFTTKPIGLGTGLGLPICHSIVTRMGGGIRVESAVGHGTTFFVAIPTAQVERNATPFSLSPMPARLAKRARILVIDDEVAVATMLSRVLDEEHEVEIALSAEQALQLMATSQFDVVFCDLLMPHMTGMDLFAEVSKRHPGRERHIVFMTGGAFTPRAAQFLSHVANPRIEKPFDLRAVRGILRELLLKLPGPVSPFG